MRQLITGVRRFLVDESGPTAVEYAIMLSLIITACVVAISAVGSEVNAIYVDMETQLPD